MKSAKDYIAEARENLSLKEAALPKEIQDRNAKIDFEKIITSEMERRNPANKEKRDEILKAVEYIKSKKVFSLNKMTEVSSLPPGTLKAIIEIAKEAIDASGWSRAGSGGSSYDRGAAIDSYLKQKWISR